MEEKKEFIVKGNPSRKGRYLVKIKDYLNKPVCRLQDKII